MSSTANMIRRMPSVFAGAFGSALTAAVVTSRPFDHPASRGGCSSVAPWFQTSLVKRSAGPSDDLREAAFGPRLLLWTLPASGAARSHPYLLRVPSPPRTGQPVQAFFGESLQLIGTGGVSVTRHERLSAVSAVTCTRPRFSSSRTCRVTWEGWTSCALAISEGRIPGVAATTCRRLRVLAPFFWRLARSSAAFVTNSAATIARTSSRLAFIPAMVY